MKNLNKIIEQLSLGFQVTPPGVPSAPPGSIPLPPRRPTTPTAPPTAPPQPGQLAPRPFRLCDGAEPLGAWPPRVVYNGQNSGMCDKINGHIKRLASHITQCEKECGKSEDSQFFDFESCLIQKWNRENSQIRTMNTLPTDNAIAATPIEQSTPSPELEYPIRPGLTQTERRNCIIYRNKCACQVKRKKAEFKIQLLALAEKYSHRCKPFEDPRPGVLDRTLEKFNIECSKLKKPSADKCAVKDGKYENSDCADYCKKCR